MAIIKKKDLKSFTPKKNKLENNISVNQEDKDEIKELVNSDGSFISGDHTRNSNREIETGPVDVDGIPQTTDDYAATAIQPRNWWTLYGNNQYGGTNYSHGVLPIGEAEKKVIAKDKMEKMVEDLIKSKPDYRDMVKKTISTDINRNKIPDLDDLTNANKQIVVSKLNQLVESIKHNALTSDEIGIIIYYLIANVNITKLSDDYKNIIKKKLYA